MTATAKGPKKPYRDEEVKNWSGQQGGYQPEVVKETKLTPPPTVEYSPTPKSIKKAEYKGPWMDMRPMSLLNAYYPSQEKKVKDYTIIMNSDSLNALLDEIKKHREEGWEVFGAPSINVSESDDFYYFSGFQAMTREID